jgi:hypothetical protein
MTATQLQLPLDPLRNQLTAPEIAAAEAVIEDQAVQLAAHGVPARRCQCTRPWGEPRDQHCARCGRDRTREEDR